MSSQQLQERLNAAYSEVLIEAKQSGTPISFIKNDKLIRQYPDWSYVKKTDKLNVEIPSA
jgi:hypothetical protein